MSNESHDLTQITQAAHGMVSGTLGEWPHLKNALEKRGIILSDSTGAFKLQRICVDWLRQNVK